MDSFSYHMIFVSFHERYQHDLTATRKKLQEAENRIASLEKDLKQSHREKEVAIHAYTSLHRQASSRKPAGEIETKDGDASDDNRQLIENLEADKTALIASNEKLLVKLMKYQEENDILRTAVEGMLEEEPASAPAPSLTIQVPAIETSKSQVVLEKEKKRPSSTKRVNINLQPATSKPVSNDKPSSLSTRRKKANLL